MWLLMLFFCSLQSHGRTTMMPHIITQYTKRFGSSSMQSRLKKGFETSSNRSFLIIIHRKNSTFLRTLISQSNLPFSDNRHEPIERHFEMPYLSMQIDYRTSGHFPINLIHIIHYDPTIRASETHHDLHGRK